MTERHERSTGRSELMAKTKNPRRTLSIRVLFFFFSREMHSKKALVTVLPFEMRNIALGAVHHLSLWRPYQVQELFEDGSVLQWTLHIFPCVWKVLLQMPPWLLITWYPLVPVYLRTVFFHTGQNALYPRVTQLTVHSVFCLSHCSSNGSQQCWIYTRASCLSDLLRSGASSHFSSCIHGISSITMKDKCLNIRIVWCCSCDKTLSVTSTCEIKVLFSRDLASVGLHHHFNNQCETSKVPRPTKAKDEMRLWNSQSFGVRGIYCDLLVF